MSTHNFLIFFLIFFWYCLTLHQHCCDFKLIHITSFYIYGRDDFLFQVEGEEIQIGPDVNAISFTKSRSPLTSADLRLSENLAKSLQIMNVEASHHSPSVTVSIFDALAEILTSTPRPHISSTTEVMPKQNPNNDVKQTFVGVSSNDNINSVKGFATQDIFVSVDNVSTIAKSVQTTEQTTPNVSNRMVVGGMTTPSQNYEIRETSPLNAPQKSHTPTLPPSTPVSARKPFAIKVLYADTEPTTDKTTAAMTTYQQSTESSTMVYSTLSDFVFSNKKIVSPDLTSMLSNNIKNIIQNMDEDSRAKLSVDMVKLLNSLIPKLSRPLKLQDDIDFIPNTTPYSLEDIKDTENIVINKKNAISNSDLNIFQDAGDNNSVNSTENNIDSLMTTTEITTAVNMTSSSENQNAPTVSGTLTTSSPVTIDTPIFTSTENNLIKTTNAQVEFLASTVTNNELAVSTPGTDLNSINSNINLISRVNIESTNKPVTIPFLTNIELSDFTVNDSELSRTNLIQLSPTLTMPSLQEKEVDDIDNIEDPSQLSRLQLWILSKKARVLKMIEEIIRNHNKEIVNAPLAELINDTNSNNISLSDRLTEITNTMTLTSTSPSDLSRESVSLTTQRTNIETTTPSSNPSLSSYQNNVNTITTESLFTNSPTKMASISPTTTPISLDTASTISQEFEITASKTASDIADAFSSTTPVAVAEPTMTEGLLKSLEILETTTANIDKDFKSSSGNIATITTTSNIETTTDSMTESNVETTTALGTELTTIVKLLNETKANDVNTISNEINVATTPSIPKKDYVIFGILPNNTVVRKDPNDDPLETLTEASPYIIYGVLPNNTIIRKFPNGTRVPRIMQKIDILPISPWSLRNPYSPIHNIPAIVRPQSNPIRVSTNIVTSNDTSNNGSENQLTTDTVNNLQITVFILCCLA